MCTGALKMCYVNNSVSSKAHKDAIVTQVLHGEYQNTHFGGTLQILAVKNLILNPCGGDKNV